MLYSLSGMLKDAIAIKSREQAPAKAGRQQVPKDFGTFHMTVTREEYSTMQGKGWVGETVFFNCAGS
jgi:hypothetical protein